MARQGQRQHVASYRTSHLPHSCVAGEGPASRGLSGALRQGAIERPEALRREALLEWLFRADSSENDGG